MLPSMLAVPYSHVSLMRYKLLQLLNSCPFLGLFVVLAATQLLNISVLKVLFKAACILR